MRSGAPLQRLWRRLPAGLRQRFWEAVAAVRRRTLPLRVGIAWRRSAPAQGAAVGVVVVGLLRDTRGVAQAARLFADGAQAGGIDVARLDIGPTLGVAPSLPPLSGELGPKSGAALVSCVNPPELIRWLDAGGAQMLKGRRHIGYWAWELPQAPPSWAPALRYVDEVWCHSVFAADAIRRLARGRTPVHVVPPPMFMTLPAAPDRLRFDLPPAACVVLCVMDLRSSAERKNPLGALNAYVRAQPRANADALLVCKLSGLESDSETAAAMRRIAAERPDIRLITDLLGVEDMASLVASADIVVSLHRAEGFGLLSAEAAWRGQAVLTTAWAAPTEFLKPDAAALIGWSAKPVSDAQGQYGGSGKTGATWADPDIDDAADRLRTLIASPAQRTAMGLRAAAHARTVFAAEPWIAHVRDLLAGLQPL